MVEAFGRVKVLVLVDGPENAVKPLAVPPFADGRIPVTFAAKSIVLAAIIAFVTARFAMVVAKLPVPEPVTSPVRVIVGAVVRTVAHEVTPDPSVMRA